MQAPQGQTNRQRELTGLTFALAAGACYASTSSPSEKHGWRVFGGMMGPVQ